MKDAVDVTLHFALQEAEAPGGLFNCGTGQAHTWVDLATPVFEAMGLPVAIEFIEMPEALRGKYQYFTESDVTKLRGARLRQAIYTAAFGGTGICGRVPSTPGGDGVEFWSSLEL